MGWLSNKTQQAKNLLKKILKFIDQEVSLFCKSLADAVVGEYIIKNAIEYVFSKVEQLKKLGASEARLLKHAISSLLGHGFGALHTKPTWEDIIKSQAFESIAELFEDIVHLEDHIKVLLKTTANYLSDNHHLPA